MDDNSTLTFFFKNPIGDQEHDYYVTMNHTNYELARDGRIIATLVHDTEWQQLDGVPLPLDFIRMVGEKIESHFD